MKTVVGLYSSKAQANKVKSVLTSQGYDSSDITVIEQTLDTDYNSGSNVGSSSTAGQDYTAGAGTDTSTGARYGSGTGSTGTGTHESVGEHIKDFFSSLTGHEEHHHRAYAEGVSKGGALLAVTVPDERAEDVANLLYSQGASDIRDGSDTANTSTQGRTGNAGAEDVAVLQSSDRYEDQAGNQAGYDASNQGAYQTTNQANDQTNRQSDTNRNTNGEQVIPVVAEELQVGKREVEHGGVRIFTRVVSQPANQSVTLHDERVVVDRRPADRPANEADFQTGDGVVEVTARGEEAVVGKRSRVVEEVVVRKEANDRTEQINETVRHTEIEVEPETANTTTTATGSRNDRDR